MSPTESASLVNQITSTWPAGVRAFIWTDALSDLDYGVSRDAYVNLRASDERPPSIARFIAAYRAADRLPDTPPDVCELCDGSGWVEVAPERAHNPRTCRPDDDHPCACSAVEPCRCTAGQKMKPVHSKILDNNDRTRRALAPGTT